MTPKCTCGLKRIPEVEIRRSAESVLKTQDYEAAVVEQIKVIRLFNDKLEYVYKDGGVRVCSRE